MARSALVRQPAAAVLAQAAGDPAMLAHAASRLT
jgi:hypothetical protein